ncbi:hypothetical protein F5148DRAFT_1209195 [Russula earlei]|uniref:Uncharacterized protein n=1 Tax=Russula earlei TaxID=71964 RepID=A0ACC0U7B9_9AGAM|nr:hypothetical protein F5148DRAFT_1209195 [Russula earlei]
MTKLGLAFCGVPTIYSRECYLPICPFITYTHICSCSPVLLHHRYSFLGTHMQCAPCLSSQPPHQGTCPVHC